MTVRHPKSDNDYHGIPSQFDHVVQLSVGEKDLDDPSLFLLQNDFTQHLADRLRVANHARDLPGFFAHRLNQTRQFRRLVVGGFGEKGLALNEVDVPKVLRQDG